jgi:hypothetical protein
MQLADDGSKQQTAIVVGNRAINHLDRLGKQCGRTPRPEPRTARRRAGRRRRLMHRRTAFRVDHALTTLVIARQVVPRRSGRRPSTGTVPAPGSP